MDQGKVIIFSAPSGSGKTTIVHHLLEKYSFLDFSVSATTRKRRGEKEIHGKDYYFLSVDEFQKKIREEEFIEWEEVYKDVYYGTMKSEVNRLWKLGKHVLFDVDVKGGIQLKKYFREKALAIFVKVADFSVLEERLRHRNTESEENIQKRLAKAEYEMSFEDQFDVSIISQELENTLANAEQMVNDFIFSEKQIPK